MGDQGGLVDRILQLKVQGSNEWGQWTKLRHRRNRLRGKRLNKKSYLTPFNFRPPLIFGRGWPKIRGAEKVKLFWVAEN